MGSIGLLVVFCLGMALGSSAYQRPMKVQEDRRILQNLNVVAQMYLASSQQIQLDQETVDRQIAQQELALQMAAKQLVEIQQKLVETQRRLSGCQPQEKTSFGAAPGFDIMPPFSG
ncbi:uncharacterized protein LOC108164093 [Drosophila miranda]|uniref:uncharacterized protein LOC108164093 n=1 Tax=Drosophila miranda TaxID=7229 RepID=UPI0007E6BEBB|nr:uncharacterized protein LOC108164093 [Drosophila miranda]